MHALCMKLLRKKSQEILAGVWNVNGDQDSPMLIAIMGIQKLSIIYTHRSKSKFIQRTALVG